MITFTRQVIWPIQSLPKATKPEDVARQRRREEAFQEIARILPLKHKRFCSEAGMPVSDWADSLQPSLKINDNKRVSRCPPVVLDCHPTRILFSSSSPTFFLLTPSLIAPKMSRSCGPKLFWAWLLMPMRSLWYSKPSGRWCGNCTRTGSETAPRQRKLWSYCKSRSSNVRDLNEKWLPWCHHEHKRRPIDRTLSRYTFVWGNFFDFGIFFRVPQYG